ncbi:uncharacterized protein LOC119598900 [Penaeus monodon]|uniref:uncharacterized protein LOC119598900 n=1 Tax=Penaeus monodon TaxID=6687 RepID=UPI0018A7B9F9|nr:uncharacterized protein LOC119598900 [Penaeus monodon]
MDDLKLLDSHNEKVLGLIWTPTEDRFIYKVKLNFATKFRNVRKGPYLDGLSLDANLPKILTKRMIQSQVAAIYDPLGLNVPFTLIPKVLMRETITNERNMGSVCGWDDAIPERLRDKWSNFFHEVFELENLSFARCVKPENALGKPMLVIYSDGSLLAYGACAYVRWELVDGHYESHLVMAKNRIAPIKQLTIPHLELCGGHNLPTAGLN